jgi:hypothetical protein
MNESSDQPHAPEICQLVADLYTAQLAMNGRVDLFELKKAVMRRFYKIDLRDDLTPEMLPKGMDRALDTLIENALFKLHLDSFLTRHPDKDLKLISRRRFPALLKFLLRGRSADQEPKEN